MRNLLVGLILLAGLGVGAHAAEPLARKEADFTIPNYRFRSGETIPELRIHYVTLGTPQRDASGHVNNAVLLLHGTTSNAQFFLGPNASGGDLYAELLAEGHPLDATRYYVIIPDAIGHGKSSKPSDGSHAKFPRYGYEDIVDAEYRLIVEGLGVDHLTLVLGTSMGGSLSWLWGERHPDFVDKLVPIASAPVQIAGRNYILRRLLTEAIRTDPEWNEGNYQSQPTHWRSVLPLYEVMFLPAPKTQSKAPNREKAQTVFDGWVSFGKKTDANDFLYAWDSSWDYNPEPDLNAIKAKVLAINFADDPLNPPETGVAESAIKHISTAKLVLIPASPTSFGHLNISHPEVWKTELSNFLK